jgi:hypothetical protein
MPNLHDSTADYGFPAPAALHCALSATLLESLSAIAAECDLLRRTALHYSLTRHVHSIEETVAEMVDEITGGRHGMA